MERHHLRQVYTRYIECLNRRDLAVLDEFVADDVRYNGGHLGLAGYRRLLEQDVEDVPDLRYEVDLLVTDRTTVAARLAFDCTPVGRFLGLDVDGRRVSFHEHVFYRFEHGRIVEVRSIIDRTAIEAQLA